MTQLLLCVSFCVQNFNRSSAPVRETMLKLLCLLYFMCSICTAEHSEQNEVKRIPDAFNPQNVTNRYIDETLRDFDDPMSIQVLVMGKVGVGKSTLVDALIGGDSVLNVTSQLEKKIVIKNGILINICDTPGLANVDLEDDDTLQYALQECREIDLLLFCISMTDRIGRVDIEEMKAITDIFTIDIWKKAMFVLTFANTYKPDQKEQFVDKVEEWTQELKERISKIIGPELGSKVPVVPAGHDAPNLPDRASWISEFWIQGFRRMGLSRARLHSNTEEMKLSQEMYTTPDVACDMTTEEAVMSESEIRITGLIVGGIVVGAIGTYAIVRGVPLLMVDVGVAVLAVSIEVLNYFGQNNEEETFNCHKEALNIEEYPE